MTVQKSQFLRIGIDVGGTNTDAVLMDGRAVLATIKQATTPNVGEGLARAVRELLHKAKVAGSAVQAVMVGTTQFINAFLERKHLAQVAVVRLALPKTDGVPPLLGWPETLLSALGQHVYMANGGAHYTGHSYRSVDETELEAIAADILSKGLVSVAISTPFAPLRPDIEQEAVTVFRRVLGPEVHVTLSHQVGGIGLVDRENAAIINACLRPFSARVIADMERSFGELGVDAPLFISQNDGTLITPGTAAQFPILTCAAGPTNSLRGAAFLTGLSDGLVVDVGGTTTDIGALVRGFPRETSGQNDLGGVRTNFRMPDTLSLAMGGGSLVHGDAVGVSIGPDSLGFRIREESRLFGGSTLTTTDVAVAALGLSNIGDPAHLVDIDPQLLTLAMSAITQAVEQGIDKMRISSQSVPVVLVGGGSILLPDHLEGASEVLRPDYSEVANAIGAAIAQVSGRVDQLFDMSGGDRDQVLKQAVDLAIEQAVLAGAERSSVNIVEVTEIPMTHMQTGATRVLVRAVGDLDLDKRPSAERG